MSTFRLIYHNEMARINFRQNSQKLYLLSSSASTLETHHDASTEILNSKRRREMLFLLKIDDSHGCVLCHGNKSSLLQIINFYIEWAEHSTFVTAQVMIIQMCKSFPRKFIVQID